MIYPLPPPPRSVVRQPGRGSQGRRSRHAGQAEPRGRGWGGAGGG